MITIATKITNHSKKTTNKNKIQKRSNFKDHIKINTALPKASDRVISVSSKSLSSIPNGVNAYLTNQTTVWLITFTVFGLEQLNMPSHFVN